VQFVGRADRTRPAQFIETDSKDAIRRSELTFHEETHGQRCGVPAACREPAKHGFARGRLVEVVGLRIELRGERYDLILVDA